MEPDDPDQLIERAQLLTRAEAFQAEASKQLALRREAIRSIPAARSQSKDLATLISGLEKSRDTALQFRQRTEWHHVLEGYNELIDEARDLI
jgi:hypothetical protein